MNTQHVADLISVLMLSASLVGWGFLWGFQYAAGQFRPRLRLRCLRLASVVVKPTAYVTGIVFWRLEAIRARLQTAIANEEVRR